MCLVSRHQNLQCGMQVRIHYLVIDLHVDYIVLLYMCLQLLITAGRQGVHTFEWAMSTHAHSCTSLYLDTDATQLALNPMVSLYRPYTLTLTLTLTLTDFLPDH